MTSGPARLGAPAPIKWSPARQRFKSNTPATILPAACSAVSEPASAWRGVVSAFPAKASVWRGALVPARPRARRSARRAVPARPTAAICRDYIKNAAVGGAFGTAGGAIGEGVGAAAGNIYNRVRDVRNPAFPEPVIRGARADVEGLENLPRLGPDAMLPDAGPSMQATAQQAALGIGPNRTSIVNALMERDLGHGAAAARRHRGRDRACAAGQRGRGRASTPAGNRSTPNISRCSRAACSIPAKPTG